MSQLTKTEAKGFKNLVGDYRFTEPSIEELDLSTVEGFLQLLSFLCGQEVRLTCRRPSDPNRCQLCPECINFSLMETLIVSGDPWNYARFSRALLLINQPTVSKDFFETFFEGVTVEKLRQGVVNFRGMALLTFGNFRFAYKMLAPMDFANLKSKLGEYLADPIDVVTQYTSRGPGATTIHEISDEKRWLLGYISGVRLRSDKERYEKQYPPVDSSNEEIEERRSCDQQKSKLNDFHQKLTMFDSETGEPSLDGIRDNLEGMRVDQAKLQSKGWSNTIEYLTSDYLDVYVATSMRESWEYESTAEFTRNVFGVPKVLNLRLRYFDPTLSYLKNRIDKGLVEGLMLRRAKCTLYMVQETDTLGKDSELASTLAQGKPVIAFVPSPSQAELETQLQSVPLRFIKKRAMLFMGEDLFSSKEQSSITEFLQMVAEFSPLFELVGDEEELMSIPVEIPSSPWFS